MSDRIKDLLHEVADGVDPGDRLDAIRAETSGGRRTSRGWWAAGGTALVAASVVAALVLTTGRAPQRTAPDPADSPDPRPTATSTVATRTVPIYFVGDTPDGPRLYREFQKGPGPMSAETFALDASLSGASLDPDYRSMWPEGAVTGGYLMSEGEITVDLVGDLHDRPAGMSVAEASLAVEQVVRTAQALFGHGRVPVRLTLDNRPTDQVLGVPTSEPLSTGSDLAVLAHVSLTEPAEGALVDNDEPFTVRGLGNSFEGNIVTRLVAAEGRDVIDPVPAIAGTYEDRLFPYEVAIDISAVPPGDYVVFSQTDDPSGQGRVHTDSRRITIVD